MFGAVEPVWRMVVRYVSVLAAFYAATRGKYELAAGLAAFWLLLTVLAHHTASERLQAGWLSVLFTKKPRPELKPQRSERLITLMRTSVP